MAIPIYEHDSGFLCDRASTVINADNTTLAINEANEKTRAISSPYEQVGVIQDHAPIAQDEGRGKIICSYPGTGTQSTQIHTTTNGTSFTKIADRLEEPFASYAADLGTAINLFSCRVMPDGSYLLSVGKSTAWVSGEPNSKLYRSDGVDFGENGWVPVLDMQYGYVDPFGWAGIDGNRVVVSEYGPKDVGDTGSHTARQTFLSEDCGINWELISDLGDLKDRHIHTSVFDPTNSGRVFISVGDESNTRGIFSLTDNDTTAWTQATVTNTYQPTNAIVVGDYIYFSSDNSAQPSVQKYSPATGEFTTVLLNPGISGATTFTASDPDKGFGYFYSIEKAGGLYYTCSHIEVSASSQHVGVFVSTDCENWTTLARTEAVLAGGNAGYFYIGGVVNGNLFVTHKDGTNQGEVMVAPSVQNKTTVMSSFTTENYATANNNDTFEASGHEWTRSGDISSVVRTEDEAYEGEWSLKAVYVANGSVGEAVGPRINFHLGYLPQAGDYITMSAWVKTSNPNVLFRPTVKKYVVTEDDQIDSVSYTSSSHNTNEWRYLELTVKAKKTFIGGEDIAFELLFTTTDGVESNIYIDNVQYLVHSSPISLRDFNRDEIANDLSPANMLGLGNDYTATLAWRPETTIYNLIADMPICKLKGITDEYIDVYWSQSDKMYKATDGTTTITSTDTIEPGLHDTIQVAIAGDGTGTTIYIADPLNGLISFGDGSTMPLGSQPSEIDTVLNESGYGYGTYTNIRGYDSVLTEEEVGNSFDALSELIPVPSTAGGYRARYA